MNKYEEDIAVQAISDEIERIEAGGTPVYDPNWMEKMKAELQFTTHSQLDGRSEIQQN